MIKTSLPADIIIERYKVQLREWEVAKLDAAIAHETHQDIGSAVEVVERLANRVIETEKAVRALQGRINELEHPTKEACP